MKGLPGAAYEALTTERRGVVRVTPGIARLCGFEPDQFGRQRGLIDIVHPEDKARVQGFFARLDPGQPYELEYRLAHIDGRRVWVQDRGRASEAGHAALQQGFLLDISERMAGREKQWELRLLRERQQRALFTVATSSAVADGIVDEVSMLATRLVAAAVHVERASVWLTDLSGKKIELLALYTRTGGESQPELSLEEAQYPAYFAAIRSGRVVSADDAQNDPRTRELRPYLEANQVYSLLDAGLRAGGEIVGVLCLEHIGEPRHWEQAEMTFATEMADQLSHALLNRDRREAKQQQAALQDQLIRSQKMESMGRLAGGIAHDFNNLLTVIIANAELAADPDEPSEAKSQCAQEILAAGEQATELTSQLLLFSRNEHLELTAVDAVSVLEKHHRLLRRIIDESVELKVSLPEAPLFVRCTDGLLQQVITNLVVNARDALAEASVVNPDDSVDAVASQGSEVSDGGHITIKVSETELDSESATTRGVSAGSYVAFYVMDDGCGMSPELTDKVFEPFFTTKAQGKGTGLGLSTVYGIVKRCHGSIDVQSEPGRGTTFRVLLPRSSESAQNSARPGERRSDFFGDGRLVLVCEDSPALRGVVVRMLKSAGFRVCEAGTTESAVALMRRLGQSGEAAPDLILSDVIMPGAGAAAIVPEARRSLPDAKVLLMSGHIDARSAAATEGLPRVAKPFTREQLLSAVTALLGLDQSSSP